MRGAALALALCLAGNVSLANGRFPLADDLCLGPGAQPSRIVLRTTFGLLASDTRGTHWDWICENAYDGPDGWDPSLAIGEDGTVFASLPTGARSSTTLCDWSTPATVGTNLVTDFAQTPDGRVLVATYGLFGSENGVLRSDDGGRSWRTLARTTSVHFETVDVAPGDTQRLYLGGLTRTGDPTLLRSDDGGATLVTIPLSIGNGFDCRVSAISPRDPGTVWLRVGDPAGGTRLYRGDEGGARLTLVHATRAPMKGLALSDDGLTVWAGSDDPTEGLLRGPSTGPLATVHRVGVRCLRQRNGLVFVCTSEAETGYSLGCSRDGGAHLDPLVSYRRLAGPLTCPPNTTTGNFCTMRWPEQNRFLQNIDAGAPPDVLGHALDAGTPSDDLIASDTAHDAATDDVVSSDHTAPMDAAAPPPRPASCACRAARPTASPRLALLGCLGALILGRRRALRPRAIVPIAHGL